MFYFWLSYVVEFIVEKASSFSLKFAVGVDDWFLVSLLILS